MASLRLLVISLCFLAACQATAPLYNTHVPSAVPGEYLVVLKAGSVGLASTKSVNLLNSFNINGWRALHVKVEADVLAVLMDDVNVEFVEANAQEIRTACTLQQTGRDLWGLTRTSSRDLPVDYDTVTHKYGNDDGTGVDAYILDTGVQTSHIDFGGRAFHGFTAPLISEGNADLNGHGTHCAGTVAGRTHGIAKYVNLIAVKVMSEGGTGYTSDIVAGMEYVTGRHQASSSKKSVINLSLGATGTSPSMEAALESALQAGVHAAVAAGNSDDDACGYTPARVEDALTVAASTIGDDLASFTNYGTCVDVIAPGSDILSTYIGSSNSATARMSGTSMSAPHIAGWVARYLSTFPDGQVPSPVQVKDALESSGTWNAIKIYSPKDRTPNLLLYAACD